MIGERPAIAGVQDVRKFLDTIPKELGKGAPNVVNAMLGPVAAQMKKFLTAARVKRTGLLRKSLIKKVRAYKSGLVWGAVGPSKDLVGSVGKRKVRTVRPSKYAHLVNLGTLPHEIKFKTRNRTMMHPGTAAHPFQHQALEASKAKAIAKGEAQLEKVIAKAVAKGHA